VTRLLVRLTPRGGRDALEGWSSDGVLRVRVSAAPSDGAANAALLRLLATTLAVAPSRVRLARGERSRMKQIEVEGLTAQEIRLRIGG
jgi:uncharacterized protein YggU (UPF0235/DUF167 family)